MDTEEKVTKQRTGIAHFERRTYPRFSVDLPVEYYQINSSSSQAGHALNASEGGLLIYFPEQMEIGQYISLKLFFSLGSELNTIEVLAEVVWMDMYLGKGWGDYRCGVKFINISPEDRTRLKSFLIGLSE
jgi:c-di-GMP-binding flagellar brake protein YcgR